MPRPTRSWATCQTSVGVSSTPCVRLIAARQVTGLELPAAYWHEWVHHFPELKNPVPRNVRLVVVGGEKASSSAYATWLSCVGSRVRWINSYGPTETVIDVTFWKCVRHSHERRVPIGRPVANTQIYILDPAMQPVPAAVTA